MADDKVFKPEVLEPEDPNEDVISVFGNASQTKYSPTDKDTEKPETETPRQTPQEYIASEVISKTFDTQSRRILGSFVFGETGAMRIGNYEAGVSGDINISPNGIVARNSSGETTFALDGETGDATFKGTVAAGSVITGYLAVGGAADDINGNATTINGGKITTGTITANKLSVSTLSAINANLGTITAGSITGVTITGSTIQTSTGSSRIELTSSPVRFRMLDTGNERVVIQADGVQIYGSAPIKFRPTGSSTDIGYIGATSDTYLIGTSNADTVYIANTKTGGDISLVAQDELRLSGNDIKLNGVSKSAIVPYREKYLSLYCVEAPEVWFFDFAKDIDSIDPRFLEVTEGDIKTLTTDDGEKLVFRRRRGFGSHRFEERTKEEFDANNKLWSLKK